jgi:hypothetical protein
VRWPGRLTGKATCLRSRRLRVRIPPGSSIGQDALAEQPGVLASLSARRPGVRIPSGALDMDAAWYAKRQSGGAQTSVPVGSTPTSATLTVPSSSGQDACLTSRIAQVRVLPGRLAQGLQVLRAAHLPGTEAVRVRVSGRPLTNDGPMVQRDDVALAWRRSGFDSRWVHWQTEGSRIRLAGPRC